MGGIVVNRQTAGTDKHDENSKENNELLHLQADVEIDGSAVTLSFHMKAGEQIDLSVPIGQMQHAVTEMGEAGDLMMHRRLIARDKGRSAFEDLMRASARAKSITPTLDKETGDVVIIYRFPDRMPFSVRVTREQFYEARVVFSAELKRSSN